MPCVVYEPANGNRLWQWEQTAKDTAGKPITETQGGQRALTRKQRQLLKAKEGEQAAKEPCCGIQELVVPRTAALTYHDSHPGKHDGGNQLPDPAQEGKQRAQSEHRGEPVAPASQCVPSCPCGYYPLSSLLTQLRQLWVFCMKTWFPRYC